jgi:CDP-paratose 2-epimerase
MKILITGGCGFIGCNAAVRFAELGHAVVVLDNFSRPSAALNLEWMRTVIQFELLRGDIRDTTFVNNTIQAGKFDMVLHLAAQVAVTTSVEDPASDFSINAFGTLNLLEALRRFSSHTLFIYSSTNKVYGKLESIPVDETPKRYVLRGYDHGIPETHPLDFHSPYGCSKGAADQYTADYARIYKLRTVTLRQSCIYGPRQFGVEDQGWVAWFTLAHHFGRPITVYGTGKQVRDLLYMSDLIDCYLAIASAGEAVAGETFNIGGGPENAISILELFDLLEAYSGKKVVFKMTDWRPGDQPVFVSDNSKALRLLNWKPRVKVPAGLERLMAWVTANRAVLESLPKQLMTTSFGSLPCIASP